MRSVKRGALAAGLCLAGLILAGPATADVSTTTPAGLIIFPKVEVNLGINFDTEIQISNTAPEPVHVRCYLVNANSHCSNVPDQVCESDQECGGGFCLPGWTETDFRFTLTKFQPIVWRLSRGLQAFPLDGLINVTQDGQFNADSNIPPAPETPFLGELKCFQVDEGDNPVARNDLKGEATYVFASEEIDAELFNAVGLQSTGVNDGNDILCIGGTEPTEECPEPEYNGCPSVLILDHFFDGAPNPVNGAAIFTVLNLVPCSEDFLTQTTVKSTIQFLVFNEFEQRLSTSRRIDCLLEIFLSDIDTRPGDQDLSVSIFSIFVQGTLSGQTRIRPVQTGETTVGHGWVGFADEGHFGIFELGEEYFAAFQLHHAGTRTQGDIIRAPRE